MKKLLPITLLTVAATTATAGAQSLSGLELGLTGGYAGGLSGEIFVHAPNVAGPVGVKAGVAYTRAADAINDNSPELPGISGPNDTFGKAKAEGRASESGSHTVVSLDGTYGLGELTPGVDATLYGGGRYGMFRSVADFGSLGATTYSSNAFGLGAGVMVSYALTGGLSLVGDLGVDHYFKSTIRRDDGNGNTDSIATNDGSYRDFDARVVRPGTVFKARIGLKTSY
ncbi:hypothetical protein [Deinococcus daejeonensis]|uniref:Outer membrane protein beta-barrel domain-containing protein n=1 Tax=Deinococcus daejeonensis TaxID=1007098 RepID=A0ABQ2IVX4_9DEIO|nr:hypothetical protein [Deinococcus daejeonensis]GGN31516.1 hypothetical protein GCM10010842_07470 [Deinococcus daejeonensis]